MSIFLNAPIEVTLAGHKYMVSALQLKEWAVVQAWIKANVPGPMRSISSADLENLNESDRRVVLEAAAIAQRSWPPRPGTAAWFHALDHPGGHEEFLHAALSKHQPEMTKADVVALSAKLALSDVMPVIMACLGLEQDDLKGQGAGPMGQILPQSSAETILEPRRTSSPKRSGGRKPTSKR